MAGGGKTATSTSQVKIPPEVLARYNAVNAQAQQVAQQPFHPYSMDPNAFVAPLTPTQQVGIYNTNVAAGMAQPYFGQAGQAMQAGLGIAAPMAYAGAMPVSPGQIGAQQIGQYMSPYLGSVVGTTMAAQAQQNAQQRAAMQGQAIQQGAFGGDRAGIAQANLAYQQNLANAQTLANLMNQGYGQALATAQQQQGVNLAAEQANRAALQQQAQNLYGLYGGYGQALAGLGTGAQAAALQGAQAQLAAGQMQQQTGQAGLAAMYNQFQQQQSYPFQVAQFLANIAEGTGALSGSTTTTTQPAPFFSDRRLKHDVHEIGKTKDGLPIYSFKYNGDDKTQIGLMAQDVEKKHPEAVGLAGGYKTVDYEKATEGARHSYATGGSAAGKGISGVQPQNQFAMSPMSAFLMNPRMSRYMPPQYGSAGGKGISGYGYPTQSGAFAQNPVATQSGALAQSPAATQSAAFSQNPVATQSSGFAQTMPVTQPGAIPQNAAATQQGMTQSALQQNPTASQTQPSVSLPAIPADVLARYNAVSSQVEPAAQNAAAQFQQNLNYGSNSGSAAGKGISGTGGAYRDGGSVNSLSSMGGAVAPEHAGLGFERGGYLGGGLVSSDDINAILKAQQAFMPPYAQSQFAAGAPGGGKAQVPTGGLHVPSLATAKPPTQQQPTGMQQIRQATGAVEDLEKLYGTGKSLAQGAGKVGQGLSNVAQGYDWSGAASGQRLDDLSQQAAQNIDLGAAGLYRGGLVRLHREDGGETDDGGQSPEDIYEAKSGLKIPLESPQAKLNPAQTPSGSSGGSGLGDIASIASLGSKIIPFFLKDGGLVPRHGYATDGEVQETAAEQDNLLTKDPARYTYERAVNQGVDPRVATALATQFHHESGFDWNATHDPNPQGVPTGYGVMGWNGPRLAALREQSGAREGNIHPSAQVDYAISELRGKDPGMAAVNQMAADNPNMTASEIAAEMSRRGVRPRDVEGQARARAATAEQMASAFAQNQPFTSGRGLAAAQPAPSREPALQTNVSLTQEQPTSQQVARQIQQLRGEPDWMQRNQEWFVPVLKGLAGMAASPSRYLLGAALTGLGTGAQAYQDVQNAMQERALKIAQTSEQLRPSLPGMVSTVNKYGQIVSTYPEKVIQASRAMLAPQREQPPGVGALGVPQAPSAPAVPPVPTPGAPAAPVAPAAPTAPTVRSPLQVSTEGGQYRVNFTPDPNNPITRMIQSRPEREINTNDPEEVRMFTRQLAADPVYSRQMEAQNKSAADRISAAANTTDATRAKLNETANAYLEVAQQGPSAVGIGPRAEDRNLIARSFQFINGIAPEWAKSIPGYSSLQEKLASGKAVDAAEYQQVLQKISQLSGTMLASQYGERAAAVQQAIAGVLPSLNLGPKATAAILADMYVNNQREADFAKYADAYNARYGTYFGAQDSFSTAMSEKYQRDRQAIEDALTGVTPDNKPRKAPFLLWRQTPEGGSVKLDRRYQGFAGPGVSRYFVGG